MVYKFIIQASTGSSKNNNWIFIFKFSKNESIIIYENKYNALINDY